MPSAKEHLNVWNDVCDWPSAGDERPAEAEIFPPVSRKSRTLWPGWCLLVLIAGLALICGAAAFIGAVPTRIYGHDIFIYLGNGWRILNDQRPHVDFTSPWGPVGFLISALGLMISRHSADGIGYGSAILAVIVGGWCFVLGNNRLASLPRVILSLFLAALVSAPYSLGISPFVSSHAMIYNRYGYGLLGLILLECFKAPGDEKSNRRDVLFGGISTGALLGLELFLKASYFFVGVALLGAFALLLRSLSRRRILAIIFGFLLVSLCVLAYLHFDLAAVVRDLWMAASARAEELRSPIKVARAHPKVLISALVFSIASAICLRNSGSEWRGLKLPVLATFMFCADVAIISTNAQATGFPVCAVFVILVANEIIETAGTMLRARSRSWLAACTAALCLGGLLFVRQFSKDLAGLVYGAWQKEKPSTPEALLHFTSPNLKPLLLYESDDNPPSEGRMFTSYVNDGVALLERETRPDEMVLTIDLTNPFPYAMERHPPRGGHAAPTYHYNINDRYRPSDEWFFGDADIVMVPKRASSGDYRGADFYKAYEPGLKQRFDLAAEDDRFWMYRRKR
jgi:hypothetical protein